MFGHGKPVIYISRSDHFRDKESDPHGNLKVHFDLQMKNIIGWTEANRTFAKKVIAPRLRTEQVHNETLRHEEAFTRESISTQLALLRRFAGAAFKRRGFAERDEPSRDFDHRPRRLLAVTRNKSGVRQAINFL